MKIINKENQYNIISKLQIRT